MPRNLKKSGYPLRRHYGTLQRETFAVKSMQDNSSLLRLKLDMVYRDLQMEAAQQKFMELMAPPSQEPVPEPAPAPKPKRKKLQKGK